MSKRFQITAFAVMLFLVVFFAFSGVGVPVRAAPQVSSTIRFRVVVAASLATSVDVYVDGTISTEAGLKAVKPLNASGYIVATAGSHSITLDQTGTTTPVTAAFTNNFAPASDTSLVLLPDMTWTTIADVNAAPSPLQSTARLVNLSPNNNPVSLAVDAVAPAGFSGIAYKSTSAGYLPYPIGVHLLSISGSSARQVSYTFQDGHVYSIFIFWNPTTNLPVIVAKSDTTFIKATPTPTLGLGTPSPTPTPIPTVAATVTPGPSPTPRGNTNASFRVVNASPGGPNIDVLLDNAPTKLTNIAFTKASTYLALAGSAAGTQHTITIVATGTTTPILASLTANFVSQADQTLVYLPGSSTLIAFTDQNVDPHNGGNSSTVNVRFINLSLDNQAMDLWVDQKPIGSFSTIVAEKASVYTPLTILPHTLEIHSTGNVTALLPAVNAQFLSARVYTVFVFGSAASSTPSLQVVVKTDAQFLQKLYLPSIER